MVLMKLFSKLILEAAIWSKLKQFQYEAQTYSTLVNFMLLNNTIQDSVIADGGTLLPQMNLWGNG